MVSYYVTNFSPASPKCPSGDQSVTSTVIQHAVHFVDQNNVLPLENMPGVEHLRATTEQGYFSEAKILTGL